MPFTWLFSEPLFFIAWILAIVATLTIHEFSHALSALYFGDPTAKNEGRLTLNPLIHIDALGFLMLLFVGFGWARPVPINPFNFKKPKFATAIVSLAGPFANLIGVIVFGLLFKFLSPMLGPNNLLANFLFLLTLVNVSLFAFNLIPIPPLDGSKVLLSVIPDKFNDKKEKFSMYGPYILLILVIIDSFTNIGIFSFAFDKIMSLMTWFLA